MTDRQRGDRKLHTDRLRQRLGGRQVNRLTELIKIQRHTDGHLQHCWGKFTNRQTSPEWRETVGIVTELTAQKMCDKWNNISHYTQVVLNETSIFKF